MSRLIDLDDTRNCYVGMDGEYEQWNIDPNVLAEAQPEPEIYWGYPPTCERPLADVEIVSRLRDIQKQIPGGSYAIDRAIEIIEAVAERRTDQPEIIHCRECKYHDKGSNESDSWNLCGYRPWQYVITDDEHYCGYAERRIDEQVGV